MVWVLPFLFWAKELWKTKTLLDESCQLPNSTALLAKNLAGPLNKTQTGHMCKKLKGSERSERQWEAVRMPISGINKQITHVSWLHGWWSQFEWASRALPLRHSRLLPKCEPRIRWVQHWRHLCWPKMQQGKEKQNTYRSYKMKMLKCWPFNMFNVIPVRFMIFNDKPCQKNTCSQETIGNEFSLFGDLRLAHGLQARAKVEFPVVTYLRIWASMPWSKPLFQTNPSCTCCEVLCTLNQEGSGHLDHANRSAL